MPWFNCRFCKAPLSHTFCDLGKTPLSNAYLSQKQLEEPEAFYPLHVYVCSDCLLVQSPACHTSEEIFSEYAYFSSYSSTWLEHCRKFASQAIERFKLSSSSQVIEVASNDGYLLQYFKEQKIPVLGIEPAKNVAQTAQAKGIPTLTHFLNLTFAQEREEKADLLIGNNVLAHVPDINDFVKAMKCLLKKDGVISMEFPHLLRLIEENQFDTIYHEHFSYFSLDVVSRIFSAHGLAIFDVESLPTHGGSLRIYAQHSDYTKRPLSLGFKALLEEEAQKGLSQLSTYLQFQHKADRVKEGLLSFFQQAHTKNKKVAAYGAPAKGNTLLNYCGVSKKNLSFTVDRNLYKQGKFLPGTHVPIFHPEKIAKEKPDYLLILPWNLKEEIMQEMEYIRSWGGKFVIPIPNLEVL